MFHFLVDLNDQYLNLDFLPQFLCGLQLTGTFLSLQGFSQQNLGIEVVPQVGSFLLSLDAVALLP